MHKWNEDQPIYRQLRDRMVGLILDGDIPEGESIPSVRTVSAEYQINHLTVAKAYQELVDEGLVEKRRGLGMFVVDGALEKIKKAEKQRFFSAELPKLAERLRRLGVTPQELLIHLQDTNKGEPV